MQKQHIGCSSFFILFRSKKNGAILFIVDKHNWIVGCSSDGHHFFSFHFCESLVENPFDESMPLRIIVVSILLGTCRRSSAWVLPNLSQLPKSSYSRFLALNSQSGIFFEESDPDCPDEDECEIDWSAMPGFDDDEDDDSKKNEEFSKLNETTNIVEKHLIGDEADELEPREAYVRQVERSVDKSRTILTMNWEIENCEVDEDSCTDFCAECAGSGKTWCKFCRGTGIIAFGDEFRSCLLCKEGRVDCNACSGTGKISAWAKTHDKAL